MRFFWNAEIGRDVKAYIDTNNLQFLCITMLQKLLKEMLEEASIRDKKRGSPS